MTIRFGNFANFIVRNFVVIWEAPKDKYRAQKMLQGVNFLYFHHRKITAENPTGTHSVIWATQPG